MRLVFPTYFGAPLSQQGHCAVPNTSTDGNNQPVSSDSNTQHNANISSRKTLLTMAFGHTEN